jgi:branched-chain amino acid:cation transporter, LIVCS family
MKRIFQSKTIATGLAIFSMFFGAGNVVFPLVIGASAGDKNIFAIAGLLITAVGIPFLGLFATILFSGDYRKFFFRIGKIPGLFAIVSCMAMIGPFAALPRCVALAHTTMQAFMPGTSLFIFSFASCIFLYFLAVSRSSIVDILGKVLSPILLVSLLVIIVKGIFSAPASPVVADSGLFFFKKGFLEGYNTMDFLATFFFSNAIIVGLLRAQGRKDSEELKPSKELIKMVINAGIIGASLLALVYVGFSFVASFHGAELVGMSGDTMISVIAFKVLGPYGGLIANLAVSLACLTTAVALAIVFSEFLEKEIFGGLLHYRFALLITLVITFAFANVGFAGIVGMIAPVLAVWYPGLLVLSILNVLYKVFRFKSVRTPVFLTVGLVLLRKFL